jgi:hypothetical protein
MVGAFVKEFVKLLKVTVAEIASSGNEENHSNHQSGQAVSKPRFDLGTSKI